MQMLSKKGQNSASPYILNGCNLVLNLSFVTVEFPGGNFLRAAQDFFFPKKDLAGIVYVSKMCHPGTGC